MSGNSGEAGRTTASRVFAILDAFTPSSPSLTLRQISEASGLPVPTAHRLAAELVSWGGLEKTASGRYRVGFRLWRLGSLTPTQQVLRATALPFMQDLYEATHENVQLAVRSNDSVVYIEKVSGHQSVSTVTQVAGSLPLHATGVGKVILAYAEPELLQRVLSRGLARCTPHTIVSPKVLSDVVARVRAEGVAYSREEMTLGAASVAAPVLSHQGDLVASLAVVVRATARLESLAPAVRTACAGFTRRLHHGYL